VVSSHGHEDVVEKGSGNTPYIDHVVMGTDNRPVRVVDMLKLLENNSLDGVPKLVFIQVTIPVRDADNAMRTILFI